MPGQWRWAVVVVVVACWWGAVCVAEQVQVSALGEQGQQPAGSNMASGRRWVTLSVNQLAEYLFFLPLTAFAWERSGFAVVVTIVRRPDVDAALLHLVLDTLAEWTRARVHFVEAPNSARIANGAQLARMYATCHEDVGPMDTCLVSDVDMVALGDALWRDANHTNPAHYFGFLPVYRTVGEGQRPVVNDDDPWNDRKEEGKWTMLQACFPEAQSWAWRTVLNITTTAATCNITHEMDQLLQANAHLLGDNAWVFDQHVLTTGFARLRQQLQSQRPTLDIDLHGFTYRSDDCLQMDGRFRPWDERAYPVGTDFRKFCTVHFPSNSHEESKWGVSRRLFAQVFGDAFAVAADQYRHQFVQTLQS